MSNIESLNVVSLVGRLGGEPDVKYFESGSVKTKLTLAVKRPTSNQDTPPDWFNLELWGKQADYAANYLRKGALVEVKGSLKMDFWKDKNTGADRSSPVISVDSIQNYGAKRDESSENQEDF